MGRIFRSDFGPPVPKSVWIKRWRGRLWENPPVSKRTFRIPRFYSALRQTWGCLIQPTGLVGAYAVTSRLIQLGGLVESYAACHLTQPGARSAGVSIRLLCRASYRRQKKRGGCPCRLGVLQSSIPRNQKFWENDLKQGRQKGHLCFHWRRRGRRPT